MSHSTTTTGSASAADALAVDPARAASLGDARRQLHHAAQLATAAGISYLVHASDDSHTNLEWLATHGALASHLVPATTPFRIAVRAADLAMLVLDGAGSLVDEYPLDGRTIDDAARWVRTTIEPLGIDATRYSLARHYVIPEHPVVSGAPFDASQRADFEQLARWFALADSLMRAVQARHSGSDVRCWPHHFDIATLIPRGDDASIGVGLEPGDAYYDEPYLYVSPHPSPSADALPALDGGAWHTHEWIGAVLTGSRVSSAADAQRAEMQAFLASAIRASLTLTGAGT